MNLEQLTNEQKIIIESIFKRFEENINDYIEKILKEELTALQKYKKNLAITYEEMAGQRNTLIGCMKDIIENQENLNGKLMEINIFLTRIEQFFLTDTPPKGKK